MLHRVGVEFAQGGGAGFLLTDFFLDALEAGQGAALVEARECSADLRLGLGSPSAGDQQLFFGLRVLNLGLELVQRIFELLDLTRLLVVLLLEAGGSLLERVAARQRLARHVVLALLDSQLGSLLPVGGLGLVVLVALVELLLVGDGRGYLRLDLHKLVVHIGDQLLDDLLGVFSAIDHVVDIGPEERGDPVQNAHMSCSRPPRRRSDATVTQDARPAYQLTDIPWPSTPPLLRSPTSCAEQASARPKPSSPSTCRSASTARSTDCSIPSRSMIPPRISCLTRSPPTLATPRRSNPRGSGGSTTCCTRAG